MRANAMRRWLSVGCVLAASSLTNTSFGQLDFLRGDSNDSGYVDLADGIFTLEYLFLGDPVPPCLDAADANDTGIVDIADAVSTFGYLFGDGSPPPAPGPLECGPDATADALDCATSRTCPDGRLASPWEGNPLAELGVVNVAGFGAKGDEMEKVTEQLEKAIAKLKAQGGGILFLPPGIYPIGHYLLLRDQSDVLVCGKGATIRYPSDDTTIDLVPPDPNAPPQLDIGKARSAFYVLNCQRISFQDIVFEGGRSTDRDVNLGGAIYAREATDLRVLSCTNLYGSALLMQDDQPEDRGTRVVGCTSYAALGAMRTGDDACISGNRFEMPDDVDYDTKGPFGALHAIYIFAGRENLIIEGNTFRNVRGTAVKLSGTTKPIRNVVIQGNTFDDCGAGVEIGADDVAAEHVNIQVTENTFINCATNRTGWNVNFGVRVLGIRDASVCFNQFYYNRNAVPPTVPGSIKAIIAQRYHNPNTFLWGSPCEKVDIIGNQFLADESAPSYAPGSIMTRVIEAAYIGQGNSNGQGSIVIANNQIASVGSVAITGTENIGLVIEGNVISNVPTAMELLGNRIPIVRDNLLIPGPSTSSNAQIRLNSNAFPIVYDNYAQGRRQSGGAGNEMSISAGGQNPEDYPLLGVRGRVAPTEGRPEIVFAFGAGWRDGNSITVQETTYTYKTSLRESNQREFNSADGLINLINTQTGFTAEDYGEAFPFTVSGVTKYVKTGHIRVRRATPSSTPNFFSIVVTATNETAGVLLRNGTGANTHLCWSRGEQPVTGSVSVIWSPCVESTGVAQLFADDAHTAALLASNGQFVSRRDPGSSAVIWHGPTQPPAEEGPYRFRFSLR